MLYPARAEGLININSNNNQLDAKKAKNFAAEISSKREPLDSKMLSTIQKMDKGGSQIEGPKKKKKKKEKRKKKKQRKEIDDNAQNFSPERWHRHVWRKEEDLLI